MSRQIGGDEASQLEATSEGPPWTLSARGVAGSVVVVTILLYLPPLLLIGFAPRGDGLRQTVPWWTFARQELFAGRLPVWDPARLAGTPHLANVQAGLFYPLNWPLIPFPPEATIELSVVAHIALGGVFLALFASSLKLVNIAAVVAGLAYVAGAFTTARTYAGHVQVLQAMAWAPLLLIAARRLGLGEGARWAGCLAGATALSFLAGYPAVTVYSLSAAGVMFLGSLTEGTRRRRSVLLGAVAIALGLAVTAPALWPLIEFTDQSTRAGTLTLEEGAQGALRLIDLPMLVWPWFFGMGQFGGFWTTELAFWHELQGTGGLLVTLLAVFGLAKRRRERPVQILAALAGGSVLLALGTATPIYTAIYELVPALRSFRLPARFLLVWAVVVPVLAAVGFHELLALHTERLPRIFKFGFLLANVALVIQLGFILVAASDMAGASWGFNQVQSLVESMTGTLLREYEQAPESFARDQMLVGAMGGLLDVVASILGLITLMALWQRRSQANLSPRVFIAGACGAIFLQLIVVALPGLYQPTESLTTAADKLGRDNIRTLSQSTARVAFHWNYLNYAALGDVFGFRSATTYDPLLLGRTTGLIRARQEREDQWGRASNLVLLDQDGGVTFDVLGVGYFMHPDGNDARLSARPSGLPRLSIVGNATRVETAADSLAAVQTPGFDPHRSVVLEQVPGTLHATVPAGRAQRAEIISEHPGFVRARVEASTGAYLVFSESYYPGWQAVADGQVVPLVPADHAIMTVRLSPGSHNITLRFTTPWLVPSLAISFLGLLGIAGLALSPSFGSRTTGGQVGRRQSSSKVLVDRF